LERRRHQSSNSTKGKTGLRPKRYNVNREKEALQGTQGEEKQGSFISLKKKLYQTKGDNQPLNNLEVLLRGDENACYFTQVAI